MASRRRRASLGRIEDLQRQLTAHTFRLADAKVAIRDLDRDTAACDAEIKARQSVVSLQADVEHSRRELTARLRMWESRRERLRVQIGQQRTANAGVRKDVDELRYQRGLNHTAMLKLSQEMGVVRRRIQETEQAAQTSIGRRLRAQADLAALSNELLLMEQEYRANMVAVAARTDVLSTMADRRAGTAMRRAPAHDADVEFQFEHGTRTYALKPYVGGTALWTLVRERFRQAAVHARLKRYQHAVETMLAGCAPGTKVSDLAVVVQAREQAQQRLLRRVEAHQHNAAALRPQLKQLGEAMQHLEASGGQGQRDAIVQQTVRDEIAAVEARLRARRLQLDASSRLLREAEQHIAGMHREVCQTAGVVAAAAPAAESAVTVRREDTLKMLATVDERVNEALLARTVAASSLTPSTPALMGDSSRPASPGSLPDMALDMSRNEAMRIMKRLLAEGPKPPAGDSSDSEVDVVDPDELLQDAVSSKLHTPAALSWIMDGPPDK